MFFQYSCICCSSSSHTKQAAANVWVRAGAEGVVIAGRRKEVLEKTAKSLESISKGTKILAVPTDLKVEKDVQKLFEEVKRVFGRSADVVLANAGAVSDMKPLAEESISTWWSINVCSYTLLFYISSAHASLGDKCSGPP